MEGYKITPIKWTEFFMILGLTIFSCFPASLHPSIPPSLHPSILPSFYKNCTKPDTTPSSRQNVSILFYNVENLYDPYDDSLTLDDEFTREGAKSYTWSKFRAKLNHLSKTLIAAGGDDTLAFIGLCEVENRYVLNKLIYQTAINRFGYRIIHHDSPDTRGVDVAALYHPKKMKLLSYRYYPVIFPFDTSIRTRELLYVKVLLFNSDTLHIFVNHWPSRRGGQEESEGRRAWVAGYLRHIIDSISGVTAPPAPPEGGVTIPSLGGNRPMGGQPPSNIEHQTSNILIMGDFNDEPSDASLRVHLGAATEANDTSRLFNLMALKKLKWTEGTIRYRGRWSTFDQFVVSKRLLDGSSGLQTGPEEITICRFPFLLQEDPTWFGESLNRTYAGPRYLGGYSDHLPILIRISDD
jgi:hypothetical protein